MGKQISYMYMTLIGVHSTMHLVHPHVTTTMLCMFVYMFVVLKPYTSKETDSLHNMYLYARFSTDQYLTQDMYLSRY